MNRKAYFNKVAGIGDKKYRTPQLESFLMNFVPLFGLKTGQNILDAGTGTGILIPYLINAVGPSGSITAIDYTENMVKICSTKSSHLKNVSVKLQDIEEPGLPLRHYDTITCFGIFPHIVDKKKALRHMNQLLKSKGKLIIAHALSSSEIRMHHKITTSPVFYDALPEKHEMEWLLKKAGFVNFRIEDEPGRYLCTSTKL